MTRLSISLLLLGLLSTSLVAASPEFNQEEQNRNADCDNGCFFGSFPGGSCTNDAACMCTQQKYRERYFCCMAQKCAPSVMPDSIQRQILGCEARNMEFTFDAEKVCGIKLAVASSTTSVVTTAAATSDSKPATTATSTTTSTTLASGPDTTTKSIVTSASVSASSGLNATTLAFSTGAPKPSSTGGSAPTTNSAAQAAGVFNVVAILALASGLLLLQ